VRIVPLNKPEGQRKVAVGKDTYPYASLPSADGKLLFVTLWGAGSLAVVDNEAAALVADHPYPGGSRPHGVFAEHSRLGAPCGEDDDDD
jgi:hypothetical protein